MELARPETQSDIEVLTPGCGSPRRAILVSQLYVPGLRRGEREAQGIIERNIEENFLSLVTWHHHLLHSLKRPDLDTF